MFYLNLKKCNLIEMESYNMTATTQKWGPGREGSQEA